MKDRFPGRRFDVAVMLGTLVLGACFALAIVWRRAHLEGNVPSFDIYAYFYPNTLYALRALAQGHGLLWNGLQNCGQPFFANPQSALLYPLHAIFLALGIDAGLLVLIAVHLAIGGTGTYLLCRELGLTRVASIAGAVTFELGGNVLDTASWIPTLSGAYVLMPVALCVTERIVRRARPGTAVLLGAVLAIQLLAGAPQMSFFTYEVIALRIAWALAAGEVSARGVGLVLIGLVLAPLLAAVQLLPAVELAGQSVRNAALTAHEANLRTKSWETFRELVGQRATGLGTTFCLLPAALAGLALTRATRSHIAVFYACVAALCLTLSFDNPISVLYRSLPLASMLRRSDRLLWVSALAFSILVAFGADAFAAGRSRSRERAWKSAVGLLAGIGGFYALSPTGLFAWEWIVLAGLALVATARFTSRFGMGAWTQALLLVLLASNVLAVAGAPPLGALDDAPAILRKHQDVFDFIRQRLTPTDRIFQTGVHSDYSLMPKSPTVFGLPGIGDYEPMTSRRYAEFYVKLVRGADPNVWMENINQFYFLNAGVPRNRKLLNLTGARYLAVDADRDDVAKLQSPFRRLQDFGSVRVYENEQALPRAFFVSHATVVGDARAQLDRLSSPGHFAALTALLDAAPEDGFLGIPGGTGDARIESDRSEELIVSTSATAEGFLFVADQYYPGWEATVNGVPASILRANYAFRLVRVPAGQSVVVFRYRPKSVVAGLAVSSATILVVLLWCALRLASNGALSRAADVARRS